MGSLWGLPRPMVLDDGIQREVIVQESDEHFLETLDMDLVAGSNFTATTFSQWGNAQIILNRSAVRAFGLTEATVIGARIASRSEMERGHDPAIVVDVMEDVHGRTL